MADTDETARLRARVAELETALTAMHRRAQEAEGIIAKAGLVEGRPQTSKGRSFGRALANYAAAKYQRERDAALDGKARALERVAELEAQAERERGNHDVLLGAALDAQEAAVIGEACALQALAETRDALDVATAALNGVLCNLSEGWDLVGEGLIEHRAWRESMVNEVHAALAHPAVVARAAEREREQEFLAATEAFRFTDGARIWQGTVGGWCAQRADGTRLLDPDGKWTLFDSPQVALAALRKE